MQEEREDVQLVPFASASEARLALEQEQISAYYVIPPEYAGGGEVELVFVEPPPYAAQRAFEDVVRLNLLAGRSPAIVERALSGANLTVLASDSGRVHFRIAGRRRANSPPLWWPSSSPFWR